MTINRERGSIEYNTICKGIQNIENVVIIIIFDRWNNEESCVERHFATRHRSLQIFWWNVWKFVSASVQKFFFVFEPIWWMIRKFHFRKFLLRRLIFLDIDPWKRRWIITHVRIGFPNPTILAISNEPYNCHKATVTANSWATTFAYVQ